MLVAEVGDIGIQVLLVVETHSLGGRERLQLSIVAFTVCTFKHPFCVCVRLYLPIADVAREAGIGEHLGIIGDVAHVPTADVVVDN